jgi:hypothetical protein
MNRRATPCRDESHSPYGAPRNTRPRTRTLPGKVSLRARLDLREQEAVSFREPKGREESHNERVGVEDEERISKRQSSLGKKAFPGQYHEVGIPGWGEGRSDWWDKQAMNTSSRSVGDLSDTHPRVGWEIDQHHRIPLTIGGSAPKRARQRRPTIRSSTYIWLIQIIAWECSTFPPGHPGVVAVNADSSPSGRFRTIP